MEAANHIAFKEWAVICAALASGEQSLILRKGGIHEGQAGFRVAHREFWLFPTGFHQEPDSVVPSAQPLLKEVLSEQPPVDEIHLSLYTEVEQVFEVHDESLLPRLSPWHIWSEQTVLNRFCYKTPGLFAILVRVHRLPEVIRIPTAPHFAGCRSWVDFPTEILMTGLIPVLTDAAHAERMSQLHSLF